MQLMACIRPFLRTSRFRGSLVLKAALGCQSCQFDILQRLACIAIVAPFPTSVSVHDLPFLYILKLESLW